MRVAAQSVGDKDRKIQGIERAERRGRRCVRYVCIFFLAEWKKVSERVGEFPFADATQVNSPQSSHLFSSHPRHFSTLIF